MREKIVVIIIAGVVVGAALVHRGGGVSAAMLADAAAILVLVVMMSLHTWISGRFFTAKAADPRAPRRKSQGAVRALDAAPKAGGSRTREARSPTAGSRIRVR